MTSKKKKNKEAQEESKSVHEAPVISEAIPIEALTLVPRKETAAKGFDFVSGRFECLTVFV